MNGNDWSAVSEISLWVLEGLENLRVTEIHYHPLSEDDAKNWKASAAIHGSPDSDDKEVLAEVADHVSVPIKYSLDQNYPNPFNASTHIRFSIQKGGPVSLKIYNILGQLVETVFDGALSPGEHVVQWYAVHHASGLYFYRFETDNFSKTKKLVVLK